VVKDLLVAVSASAVDNVAVVPACDDDGNDGGDDNDADMNGDATATTRDDFTTTDGSKFSGTMG
jgi:hypothetical protein